MLRPGPCFVYVMACQYSVKIGVTQNPELRLQTCSGLASYCGEYEWLRKGWKPLDNLYGRHYTFMARVETRKKGEEIERRAHWLLRHNNIWCEFFDATPEQAAKAITDAFDWEFHAPLSTRTLVRPEGNCGNDNRYELIDVETEMLQAVREIAGRQNVSKWIREALQIRLRRQQMKRQAAKEVYEMVRR